MKKSNVSEILQQLMFAKKIRTAELARQIQIPQPTLHRIVTGTSTKPRQAALDALADYFRISVEQLLGKDTIDDAAVLKPMETPWRSIPLYSFEALRQWPEIPNQNEGSLFIGNDTSPSDNSFALTLANNAMEPIFPRETLIVIDPHKALADRHYVLAKIAHANQVLFRQLFMDGEQYYLKALSPEFHHLEMLALSDEDHIIGSLVQARRDFS